MLVNRIRILLWEMPPMLLDIITDTIAPQPDMDIVQEDKSGMNLVDAAEQTNADIVITTRDAGGDSKDYDELLYRHGRIKVLEIFAEGRFGWLREMRPRRVALGEMSPPRLLQAIRESANIATGEHL
jgi:DNA-binding NarL/FixJ family response regulator